MQRSPKVGDIVEPRLWKFHNEIGIPWSLENRYLLVTNIMEFPEGSKVYLKNVLSPVQGIDNPIFAEEYLLNFETYYIILENVTKESLKVLYGNSHSKRTS